MTAIPTDFDIENDKMMTVKTILSMLDRVNVKVSRQTFERWVRTGYFPKCTLRVGRSMRWTERAVKAWLLQCVEDAKKPFQKIN